MSDVMRRVFVPFTVFVLCSVLTAGEVSAALFDVESSDPRTFTLASLTRTASGRGDDSWGRGDLPSDQAIFSTDVDIFLGQKRRRRGGGGRVWGNLYYGDTTIKPKGGGKIDSNFYGFQLGLDIVKSRAEYSTFFFNFNQSDTDFDHIVSSNIDNFQLGYGKFFYWSMCHLGFSGSMAYDKYKISGFDNIGTGDGLQTNLFGEFGLDFILGQWGIKPFYALQYDFLYHGNIGKAPYVLVKDTNDHGLQQLLGMRVNWKVTTILELQSRAVWVHEMLDNPPPFYRGRFSPVHGTSTPTMTFYRRNTCRDWAWIGLGAKLELLNLYFFGDYDLLINERQTTHLGSLGVCFNW